MIYIEKYLHGSNTNNIIVKMARSGSFTKCFRSYLTALSKEYHINNSEIVDSMSSRGILYMPNNIFFPHHICFTDTVHFMSFLNIYKKDNITVLIPIINPYKRIQKIIKRVIRDYPNEIESLKQNVSLDYIIALLSGCDKFNFENTIELSLVPFLYNLWKTNRINNIVTFTEKQILNDAMYVFKDIGIPFIEHIYKKEFLNTEQRSNYERLTDAQLDIINKYYENIKAKYKEQLDKQYKYICSLFNINEEDVFNEN